MREILFRGKAANRKRGQSYRTKYKNGDWVYGLLAEPKNWAGYAEMTTTGGVSGVEVDANTVGQFTGLFDTNDSKIFEGDIVEVSHEALYGKTGVVTFKKGSFMLENVSDVLTLYGVLPWCKVIGNIHDCPELLTKGD